MSTIYDTIGTTYERTRKADARIVDRIVELLGVPPGMRVLDVGAGTGNYSQALADRGYRMTALEPSKVMRDQAGANSNVNWVDGEVEELPFEADSFDAAILMLCLHHFADIRKAMREVQRVVRRGVILLFTYDPTAVEKPWLFEYFPDFRIQIQNSFPSVSALSEILATDVECVPFPLPCDMTDEFVGTAWRSPERYLDRDFREGTSAFQQLDPELCRRGLRALSADLKSGRWDERYGRIRSLDEYDHGYLFLRTNGDAGFACEDNHPVESPWKE